MYVSYFLFRSDFLVPGLEFFLKVDSDRNSKSPLMKYYGNFVGERFRRQNVLALTNNIAESALCMRCRSELLFLCREFILYVDIN